MIYYLKRAVLDIFANKFLNIITIVTIALSILVISSFILFFENAARIIEPWNKGAKIMAYLKHDFNQSKLSELELKIKTMEQTQNVLFVSKEQGLKQLEHSIKSNNFFNNLQDNPLPHALEIRVKNTIKNWNEIKAFAEQIKKNPFVEDVEYGQEWMGKFLNIFNFLKTTGYVMSGLFFMTSFFIIANTVQLALYSRRKEIEIMRLVGATDKFIITPFYIQGILQGAIGGIVGLGILFCSYIIMSSSFNESISLLIFFNIKFLSIKYFLSIILFSTLLGFLGCFLSLGKFFKN